MPEQPVGERLLPRATRLRDADSRAVNPDGATGQQPGKGGARKGSGVSDADVIRRSRSDPAEFEAIFDRHFAGVHRYLHRRVGRDLAGDLAAEVFEIAFRRRAAYDDAHADARPWLFGIAHNVLRGHRRHEVRQLRAYARTGADPVADVAAAAAIDEAPARLDAASRRREIAAALAALAHRDRETLLLHAWAELSYDEVAAALGVPVGTVRSRLSRARRQLRERLGGSGQGHVGTALVPNDERTW